MIKSLRDAQIIDGLPRIVREQPWVKALSMAAAVLHKKTMDYIDGSQIYTAIDSVAEPVLDALRSTGKSTGMTPGTTSTGNGASLKQH